MNKITLKIMFILTFTFSCILLLFLFNTLSYFIVIYAYFFFFMHKFKTALSINVYRECFTEENTLLDLLHYRLLGSCFMVEYLHIFLKHNVLKLRIDGRRGGGADLYAFVRCLMIYVARKSMTCYFFRIK